MPPPHAIDAADAAATPPLLTLRQYYADYGGRFATFAARFDAAIERHFAPPLRQADYTPSPPIASPLRQRPLLPELPPLFAASASPLPFLFSPMPIIAAFELSPPY